MTAANQTIDRFVESKAQKNSEHSVDSILLWSVLALLALGLVMVYSSSAVYAAERMGDPLYFLKRQVVAALLGIVLLLVVVQVDLSLIRKLALPIFLGGVAMLAALLIIPGVGVSAGGATRWMSIGSMQLQPSEFVKLGLVLYLASSLARKPDKISEFKAGFLGPGIVAGLPVLLVLAQPDFGTALSLLLVLFVMLFIGGARVSYLFGAVLMALPVLWHLVSSTPYRMRRLMAFMDPWSDRQDVGYQIAESLISIGSGGKFGVGLGDGRQKLFYLPEAHTDFVFSIIGEELGLVGTVGVATLFAIVVWRGYLSAFKAKEAFSAYLAIGLSTLIGMQAFANMAVAMGLLPTKGLTLPYISYGGSSLIVFLAVAGLLLSISKGSGGFLAHRPGDPR